METPKRSMNKSFTIPMTPQLQKLGLGTGVEVMLVKRSKNAVEQSPWAIKRLNKRVQGKQTKLFEERLLYEADILKQLKHPNIVGFRDLIKDKNGRQCLAMEDGEISLGDLLENRLEFQEGPLEYRQLKKMSLDIGEALKYLHTEALILHGDLKSYNVLVKGGETFKLCDFGVSVPITKHGLIDNEKHPDAFYYGTELWSAPEILDDGDTIPISTKSEMFSYGLLIYECIALVPPHTLQIDDDESIVSIKDTEEEESLFAAKFGTRPPLPEQLLDSNYDSLIGLFFMCTSELPDQRPSAAEAVKYIKSLSD